MNTKQAKPKLTNPQILALICFPIFIGALDLTIVSAVLPPILSDLQIPYQQGMNDAAWMVSGYLLSYTISMTFMGRVSDIWGRRRIYLICLGIFIAGSMFVAVAPGLPTDWAIRGARVLGLRPDRAFAALYTLIAGRVIQAFGAGALVPVGMALVGDIYSPDKRAAAFGIIGGVDTAGWVLGHLYGGVMVQYFEWPILFWINVPFAGAALLLVGWALRDPPNIGKRSFDWLGAVLITLVLAGINLGLNSGADTSSGMNLGIEEAPPSIAYPWLIAAALGLLVFIYVEQRRSHPLLNLKTFVKRNYAAASSVNILVGFCITAGLVSVPLYINTVPTVLYGIDLNTAALIAGVMLSVFTVPMAAASVLGGWIARRVGYRWATILGAVLAGVGFYLVTFWGVGQSEPVILWFKSGIGGADRQTILGTIEMSAGLLVAGIGIGFTISPIATAVVNAAPAEERGVASAVVIVMRLIGMTIGISSLTNFGVRRSQILLTSGMVGVELTDFGRQLEILVSTAAQVINEINLIAVFVCIAAVGIAFWLGHQD